MKRILFVNPSYKEEVLERVKILCLPPLSLAALAGYTPDRHEMTIIDEAIDQIDFDRDIDLVAITCTTPLAPRAYEISTAFRKKGIPVVFGGIHASMMTRETMDFADAVVAGEAEGIWRKVLMDFENGKLQRTYTSPRPGLENLPLPRRDLLSKDYFIETIQTSRGCPFDCNFCSVTRFSGGYHRLRPVEDVLTEIRQLRGNRFFFVDDNIIGSGETSTKRAFQLFEQLADLGKEWGSQICITVVESDALLNAAAKSGARFFFIGFESIESEALAAMNKRMNLGLTRTGFAEAIKKIHDRGIAVAGSFMFGGDTDTKDVFEKTVEFVKETEIDSAQFTIQTPFPGTKLYQRLARENRLLFRDYPKDWRRYNAFDVVFRPKHMTVEELKEGHIFAYKATASLATSFRRAAKTFLRTRSLLGTAASFYWNYDCYKMVTHAS